MTQNNLIIIKVKLPTSQSCHHAANLPKDQLCRLVLFLKELQVKSQKWVGTLVSQVKILDCLRRGAAQAPNLLKPWQLHPHSTITSTTTSQLHCFMTNLSRDQTDRNIKPADLGAENSGVLSRSGGRQLHLSPGFLKPQ